MGLTGPRARRVQRAVPHFVLGLDTATRTASAALIAGDTILVERSLAGAKDLAVTALPLVQSVLAESGRGIGDVELIAVSAGPGSFTGLRIGLSLAKGFALATGCAVLAVPTLAALARVAGDRSESIRPVLDARRGEVYTAAFRRCDAGLERMAEDIAATPRAVAAAITEPCVLLGDGGEAYRDEWRRLLPPGSEILPFAEFHPRGGEVARLGRQLYADGGGTPVDAMVPRYCRAAEAEVRRAGTAQRPAGR